MKPASFFIVAGALLVWEFGPFSTGFSNFTTAAEPPTAPVEKLSAERRTAKEIFDSRQDGQTVELAQLTFPDAATKEKFKRLDAAARRTAAADWHHQDYHMMWWRINQPKYLASWCSRQNQKGDCIGLPNDLLPAHAIWLGAHVNRPQPEHVYSFEMSAAWMPETGMGATVRYESSAATTGRLSVVFFPEVENKRWKSRYVDDVYEQVRKQGWEMPYLGYWTHKSYGRVSYYFQVDVDDLRQQHFREWLGDETFCRLLQSPENLRDAALSECDTLEKRLRDQIPSQKAIRLFSDHTGARSDNPPQQQPGPPTGAYKLSAAQTDAVLKDGLAEVERRRKLIRENFREMHAAVKKAFPLRTVLEESQAGGKKPAGENEKGANVARPR